MATNRQIKTKTETKVCVRTCALFALSHVIFFILFFVFRSLSVVSVLWWCAGARPSFKQFVKQCNEEAEAVAMKITFCNDEVTGDRMYALVSTPVLCSFIVVCLLCLLLCLSISPFTPWLPRSFVAVDGRSTPAQTKQLRLADLLRLVSAAICHRYKEEGAGGIASSNSLAKRRTATDKAPEFAETLWEYICIAEDVRSAALQLLCALCCVLQPPSPS